jgi:hypothetical protein
MRTSLHGGGPSDGGCAVVEGDSLNGVLGVIFVRSDPGSEEEVLVKVALESATKFERMQVNADVKHVTELR